MRLSVWVRECASEGGSNYTKFEFVSVSVSM